MGNDNPYAGLTLPTPPAGYRLAKWGETADSGLGLWWDKTKWLKFRDISPGCYAEHKPEACVFAVPINSPGSTAPRSWRFRHDQWVPPQPVTLADVPDNSPAIVADAGGRWIVAYRVGYQGFHQGGGEYCGRSKNLQFIRYLDPQPATQPTLDDVPDGRVIKQANAHHWHSDRQWYVSSGDGTIDRGSPSGLTGFTVTDYIAEFK